MPTQSQHEPEHQHVKILREIMAQFDTLFDRCPDGIYVYIDDVHKTCSERLAKMHGTTVDEWQRCESIVDTYAEPEDRASRRSEENNLIRALDRIPLLPANPKTGRSYIAPFSFA